MKKKKIFRKDAFDNLSHPGNIESSIEPISSYGWISLIGVLIVVASLIFWGFFGKLSIKIHGSGIISSSGGIFKISHKYGGLISDVRPKNNDYISIGTVIARLSSIEDLEQISILKTEIENIKSILFDINENSEEFSNLSSNLKLKEKSLEYAKNSWIRKHNIITPYSGRILEVLVKNGSVVAPGDTIATIEALNSKENNLEVIMFIDAQESKNVEIGMTVYLLPNLIKSEDYGYLVGVVSDISKYPVTFNYISQKIGDETAGLLFSNLVPVAVEVELVRSSDSPSGYKWTIGNGPNIIITSGTLFDANIIVGSYVPAALILPYIKKLRNSN